MIKPEEIRIGNWVKIRGAYYVQVKFIWDEWFTYNEQNACNYSDTEPIELTEDILIKCGFEDLNTGIGWFKKYYFTDCNEVAEKMEIQYNVKSGRCAIYDTDLDGSPAMTGKAIKYLHQLQNLFYALTNEELEINL